MVATAAANVDPFYNASHPANVVVLWGGTNDLANGSSPPTPASVVANMRTFGAARHAVGWKVVILDILPRTADNAAFETNRQAVRAELLGDFTVATADPNIWLPGPGVTYADVFVDLAGTTIGQPGANVTGPYDADHIHLVSGGYEFVAAYVARAIRLIP